MGPYARLYDNIQDSIFFLSHAHAFIQHMLDRQGRDPPEFVQNLGGNPTILQVDSGPFANQHRLTHEHTHYKYQIHVKKALKNEMQEQKHTDLPEDNSPGA